MHIDRCTFFKKITATVCAYFLENFKTKIVCPSLCLAFKLVMPRKTPRLLQSLG